MKRYIITLAIGLLIGSVISGNALEWHKCLQYKFQTADPKTSWTIQDDGHGVYIKKWNLPDTQPTKEELESIEAQAIAWYSDRDNTNEADYDNWTKREKALCRLFVKEINKLRIKNGDPAYTVAQIKAALKAEM